jgi:hypothetical protein
MKHHSWFPRRSELVRIAAAAALLPLALGAPACELVASVDRSKIAEPTGGSPTGEAGQPATGAQSGSGGNAGTAGDAGSGNESGAGSEPVGGQGGTTEPGAAGEGGAPQVVAGAAGESSSSGAGGESAGPAGKVIYLSATPKKANFGGIGAADSACNLSPPNGGTYKALIVDGTTRAACTTAGCSGGANEHIDWVLAPDTTYVRPDGTVVGTTNGAGIFVFPLDASIAGVGYSYWTGLSGDWTSSSDDCGDWAQTTGYFANEGLGDATDDQAIVGVSESCATLAGAYFACVEQ